MITRDLFIKNLWLWKCGKRERPVHTIKLNTDSLYETEWSAQFEMYMRNRLVMGAFRYGVLSSNNKNMYDRISSCIDRLKLYKETGNDEHLVDVANLVMCEFIEGKHPKKHFKAVDDGIHTKIID